MPKRAVGSVLWAGAVAVFSRPSLPRDLHLTHSFGPPNTSHLRPKYGR